MIGFQDTTYDYNVKFGIRFELYPYFEKSLSVLTLSKNVLLNISKLSTREVFKNLKHFSFIPNVTIELSHMCKLLVSSFVLNP